MSEIKVTREQTREKQATYLRERLVIGGMVHSEANSLASHIIDEFRDIEDKRSLPDLLRDIIEDAGGGADGVDEVRMLLDMDYPKPTKDDGESE